MSLNDLLNDVSANQNDDAAPLTIKVAGPVRSILDKYRRRKPNGKGSESLGTTASRLIIALDEHLSGQSASTQTRADSTQLSTPRKGSSDV